MRMQLLGLALLAGCSSAPPPTTQATPQEAQTPRALSVVIEEARAEKMKPIIKLTGQVMPTEQGTVTITAPLDGVVMQPLVKVGSYVVAGQPVAQMNNVYGKTSFEILGQLEETQANLVAAQARLSEAQTRVTDARATLGTARADVASSVSDVSQADSELTFASTDLQRKKTLLEAGVFAQTDYDIALERWQKAQAQLRAAKETLSIKQRNVPLAARNIAQLESAVSLATEAVGIARANFERQKAVLGSSNLVGASLPSGMSNLNMSSFHSAESAAEASSFQVRSRISGVVAEMSMTAGLSVTSGTVLATVVDLKQVYVDANAFENDIASMKEGDPLVVTSKTAPGKQFPGKVSYVGRVVNPETRTIQVRSLISNPGGSLRPATFVDVAISLPMRASVITIPEKALITLGDDEYVLMETGPNKYEKKRVDAGVRSNGRVEVVTGLKAGDKVVTEGNLLLESRE